MKKFARTSLIVSGILFVTGAVILIICSLWAGSMRSALSDTVSSQLHNTLSFGPLFFWGKSSNHHWNHHYPVQSGEYTDDTAALGSDITELDIDLNYLDFTLTASQDEYFHISSQGDGKYQYYTDDSVFYLNGCLDRRTIGKNQITLAVPDINFACISIDFGAGSARISSLKGESILLDIGAGELTLDGVDCDYISANVGAGSASVNNANTQNANFEIGMGELVYEGYINAELTAEVGMGNITLQIADTQNAHNYDLECAMGAITLGQKEYGGMAFETEIDNGADSNYSLECGMGSIDISFEDTNQDEK